MGGNCKDICSRLKTQTETGIANVSDYYSTTHGRKVVEDSRNIADLLKHPNKFAGMIVGICAGLLFLIIVIIWLIRKVD